MAILKVANIHFDAAGTTLIRANGANTLTFTTANTEDMRIDAAGNVLIGRTDSTIGNSVKLDVNGAINVSSVLVNGISILVTSNTYTQTVGTAGNVYAREVGTAGNAYTVTVGTAGNVYAREVGTAGNAYTQTVGTAGNVYAREVGTAGNVYAREVGTAGNAYAVTVGTAGNVYAREVGTAGNAYAQAVGTAGNSYTVTVGTAGNAYTQTVGTAGNTWSNTKLSNTSGISFNGNLTVPGEFTVGGNLIFDTTTSTRIWEPVVNTIAIITTQTERVRIDSIGNVLIGRTDSNVGVGVKLDVNGAINASSVLVNGASILATSNTYTQTVGAAANGWANTISATRSTASNAYAETVGTAGNVYAREVGTAGNAYTQTVGTAGNTWANTISNTRALASNAYAETVGTAGNAYTVTVGTAGNVYAREVGTAGNAYTQTVGTAGNTWANTISATRSTASNAYAETVGTAGNVYARAVGTADNAYAQSVGTAGNAYAQAVGTAGNSYTVTVGAAANGWSNTKLSNTSGISFNGNLTVPGEFTVGGNLIFDTTTATRIWEPAVNTLAIITTQTERMRIDATGNVLIGRTDSTVGLGVKLDVNGAINASAIYVNGAVQQSGAATYSANVGNNSANTFNVSHSLNKQFVIPAVRENSSGYYVYPDIKYTSANTIVLEFVNAPTTNQYTVIVLG